MKLYRGIQGQYINPADYAESKKALDAEFGGLEKLADLKSENTGDFVNWIKLKQARRLGFFGTNRTNIIKHAGPKGTLLVVDVPESELSDYLPSRDPGTQAMIKYGEIYDIPDSAPYTPNIIEISKCPNMIKKYF